MEDLIKAVQIFRNYIDLTNFDREIDCFSTALGCDKKCPIFRAASKINKSSSAGAILDACDKLDLKDSRNSGCYNLAQYVNKQVNIKTWSKL